MTALSCRSSVVFASSAFFVPLYSYCKYLSCRFIFKGSGQSLPPSDPSSTVESPRDDLYSVGGGGGRICLPQAQAASLKTGFSDMIGMEEDGLSSKEKFTDNIVANLKKRFAKDHIYVSTRRLDP